MSPARINLLFEPRIEWQDSMNPDKKTSLTVYI